ncbi:hypothetical protein SASPL_133077 [Salvia splendens]|uniref:Uncharacterized protein n=1 Tax=Salvia splendens TaxID=180675 RepID=A0A8X8X349_SALSN|nr:hypothetical protein SASPL_133077 [Salvia splendens]
MRVEGESYFNAFSKTTSDSHEILVLDTSSSDGADPGNGDDFEDLEDDDAELEVTKRASTSTRGSRFVIDDDDEDDGAAVDDEDGDYSDPEVWMEEEDDVVKKSLRKCGEISAELKQELYGTSAVGCDQYSEVELGSAAAARIVTQVSILEQKEDRKILRHWKWSCVLMDEAHALKDKNSFRWKNLKSVARNSRQRLMLTGTPLQNDLHELWSLLEFIMPGLFETGDVNLKKLCNATASSEDAEGTGVISSPYVIEYVCMGKEQEDAYKEAIENYRAISQARFLKSSETSLSASVIANHPLLVRCAYTDDDVLRIAKMMHPKGVFGFECTLERVVEELKSYNDFSIHRLLLFYGVTDLKGTLSDEHAMVSAKCRALGELLPKLNRAGSRILIFSQWTSMLDILEWTLDVIGVTYRRLDGSTQVKERQTIVDTYNKDTSILACLLSTRAGGQGLNLIGADTVIIHDMDFNPQIDRQVEDRCHRIGQTKPVTIYRLVTKGTVDENVYEIAKRKLTLDAAVLESGVVEDEGEMPDKILSSLLLH